MSSVLARLVAGQSPAAAFAQPPWLNKQLVTPVVHLARLPSSVTARPSGISATSVVQLLGSCAPPAARRFLVANKAGGSTPGHMEHDDSLLLWITATAQIVLDSLCSLENDIEVELKNTKDKLDRYNFVNKELKKVIGAFKMIVKEEKVPSENTLGKALAEAAKIAFTILKEYCSTNAEYLDKYSELKEKERQIESGSGEHANFVIDLIEKAAMVVKNKCPFAK